MEGSLWSAVEDMERQPDDFPLMCSTWGSYIRAISLDLLINAPSMYIVINKLSIASWIDRNWKSTICWNVLNMKAIGLV